MNLSPQAEPRDDKETKILAAAKEAFLEFGYAATSMDQVAQRARASKTTLYTRFPSKESLFSAVIAAECAAFGLQFAPSDFAGLPVDEALRRIGRRFVDLQCSPQCLRAEQLIIAEAPRFPEIAEGFLREGPDRVTAAVAAYLADAASRGLLDLPDPHFAAQHFLSAVKGPFQKNTLCPNPEAAADPDAFIAATVALFLDGARRTPR